MPVGVGFQLGGHGFNAVWLYIPISTWYYLCSSDWVAVTPQIRFMASPNPVPENGDPLLMCIVTAEPSANFSEIVRILPDGGEELVANMSNPTGDRQFQVTSILMNVKFQRDDGATFQCRSLNANGPEAVNITIIVQGELYIE